jgi:hypothetical protein
MCVPRSLLSHRSRSELLAVRGDPAACGGPKDSRSRASSALYLHLGYRGILYIIQDLDHLICRNLHQRRGCAALLSTPAKLHIAVSCNANLTN